MTKNYTCDLCKKTFNQKIDYTRHKNKKTSCITIDEIEKITKIKETVSDNKGKLINLFKNCLNTLRDNEGLTGEKALRTLSQLLILKMIEPRLGSDIDIDNYKYDLSHIQDDMVENHKKKLLEIVRFSNLCKEKEDNLPIKMKYLWEDILSNHPITKNIFLKGKNFDIQYKSTYKNIINLLNDVDFTKIEYDILGNAYEEIFKDIMTGKVLGQFFTQPLIKKMMVKLINPQIHLDGKIESCGDPTMGTGGFLITYLQHIITLAKNKDIKLDWKFIKTYGLYGKEIDPDTYQLAVSNMLISSGHIIDSLEKGDSIRSPITRKFDNILANPPFGIKGLKYDDFNYELKNEYIPIKSDNAVSLFIQAIIYMLKINGKCAVVLPDGQDLFSKTNNTLMNIREYLMKTCDLKEIIYLPTGIFTYTSIKTCVFYFVKKREGSEVLETKINISKSKKENSRDYKFSKTHQTTKVKFYDFNPYEDIKNLLVEVPIEKIASNSYSLNYTEYMKEETDDEQYEDNVVVKILGEVCEFLPKSKRQASYGEKDGKYPFFTSSQNCDKYCNEYDYSDECLIIGSGGNANIKYSSKFSCSTDNFIIKINEELLTKYAYYYLLINIDILQKGFIGIGLQHISKEYIKNIKLPIPSFKQQQDLVKYFDFIYEKTNKTTINKITELKILNEFCLKNQENYGDNFTKLLGEVCEFLPKSKRQASYGEKDGKYPFFTSSQNCDKYCNEYDYSDECLIIGSGGNANIKYSSKFSCSTDNFIIKINKELLTKYAYYYLLINIDILQKGFIGIGLQHISKEYIKNIKLPIPSLDRQKDIIKYCEKNDNLIKQLEVEIENNKKQAQLFFTNIIKSKSTLENTDLDTELDKELDTDLDKELEKDNIVIKNKLEIDDDRLTNKKTKKKGSLINIID